MEWKEGGCPCNCVWGWAARSAFLPMGDLFPLRLEMRLLSMKAKRTKVPVEPGSPECTVASISTAVISFSSDWEERLGPKGWIIGTSN